MNIHMSFFGLQFFACLLSVYTFDCLPGQHQDQPCGIRTLSKHHAFFQQYEAVHKGFISQQLPLFQ